MPTQKAPWLSKTLWINLVMASVGFFPGVETYVASHPILVPEVFAAINIALRILTKDKLSLN